MGNPSACDPFARPQKAKELKMQAYRNLKVISPRPKNISGKHGKGTRKADKIERDLEKRRVQNRKRIDFERALERFVLDEARRLGGSRAGSGAPANL